jgi:hypothetical protein
LLFNFPLEYTARKVQKRKGGLEVNGTNQPLVCADDGNLLGERTNSMEKNTEVLLKAS